MQENWLHDMENCFVMIKSRIRKWEIRVKKSHCENLLGIYLITIN